MKAFLVVLVAVITFFPFSVCHALDESQNSGTPTYNGVKIINLDDADWCSYQKKCTYIQNLRCRKEGASNKNYCDRRLAKLARKVGADTFVYQSARLSIEETDDEEYEKDFVAFGHAYHCEGEQDARGKDYLDRVKYKTFYRLQVTTIENENRCNSLADCQLIRQHECTTSRDRAELRCLKKIAKYTGGNKLVIKKESYSENTGRYRTLMDAYQCPSAPVQ